MELEEQRFVGTKEKREKTDRKKTVKKLVSGRQIKKENYSKKSLYLFLLNKYKLKLSGAVCG